LTHRWGAGKLGRLEHNRSAVWGGATLGLFVGLILGFFVGNYWMTVLYAVLMGAATGAVANILGWLGDRARNRTAPPPTVSDHWRSLQLQLAENVLGQASPADFETTQNAASMCISVVSNLEAGDGWRACYDSIDSFYTAHEARHPDIRLYAAVWREIPVEDPNDPPNGTGETIARRIAGASAHR
jgi:hypothetical protein